MGMTKTPIRRNEAMELFKLLASVLVVFIHVKFPGTVGSVTVSLARLAVPVFLAISGWFSFGTKPERLLKRLGHILVLFAAAVAAAVMVNNVWQNSVMEVLLSGVIGGCGSPPASFRSRRRP